MFSDVVGPVNTILSLHPGAFVPLLMYALIFWFFGKMFRSLVLDGHWIILTLTSLGFYLIAAHLLRDGSIMAAFVMSWPLLFLGHQAYKRLVNA